MMRDETGFTLLEILISIVGAIILMLVVTNFMVTQMRNIQREDTKTQILNNTMLAVGNVSKAVESAKSVQPSNAQADSHSPGAPGNLYSWTAVAGSGATLILAIPARDSSNNLIYSDGLHNNIYTNDYVYYLDSSNHRLYRRIIANQSAPGNAAVTTCPPASASASCPSDALVVEDVANLTTNYLDANNNSVSSPTGTEAVQMTLTQTRTVQGQSYSSSYTTVASLRNK